MVSVVGKVWVQEKVYWRTVGWETHKVRPIAKTDHSDTTRLDGLVFSIAFKRAELIIRLVVSKELGHACISRNNGQETVSLQVLRVVNVLQESIQIAVEKGLYAVFVIVICKEVFSTSNVSHVTSNVV